MITPVHNDYNSHNQAIRNFLDALVDNELKHYASDLFPELEMTDEAAFNKSLLRAQQVCETLNIPIHHHFKRIYRTSSGRIYCDYKLSHTAYILVGINGDAKHEKVAKIQMELVKLLLNR